MIDVRPRNLTVPQIHDEAAQAWFRSVLPSLSSVGGLLRPNEVDPDLARR